MKTPPTNGVDTCQKEWFLVVGVSSKMGVSYFELLNWQELKKCYEVVAIRNV